MANESAMLPSSPISHCGIVVGVRGQEDQSVDVEDFFLSTNLKFDEEVVDDKTQQQQQAVLSLINYNIVITKKENLHKPINVPAGIIKTLNKKIISPPKNTIKLFPGIPFDQSILTICISDETKISITSSIIQPPMHTCISFDKDQTTAVDNTNKCNSNVINSGMALCPSVKQVSNSSPGMFQGLISPAKSSINSPHASLINQAMIPRSVNNLWQASPVNKSSPRLVTPRPVHTQRQQLNVNLASPNKNKTDSVNMSPSNILVVTLDEEAPAFGALRTASNALSKIIPPSPMKVAGSLTSKVPLSQVMAPTEAPASPTIAPTTPTSTFQSSKNSPILLKRAPPTRISTFRSSKNSPAPSKRVARPFSDSVTLVDLDNEAPVCNAAALTKIVPPLPMKVADDEAPASNTTAPLPKIVPPPPPMKVAAAIKTVPLSQEMAVTKAHASPIDVPSSLTIAPTTPTSTLRPSKNSPVLLKRAPPTPTSTLRSSKNFPAPSKRIARPFSDSVTLVDLDDEAPASHTAPLPKIVPPLPMKVAGSIETVPLSQEIAAKKAPSSLTTAVAPPSLTQAPPNPSSTNSHALRKKAPSTPTSKPYFSMNLRK